MVEITPLNVTLYMRTGCGLCDEVKRDLDELRAAHPHRLAEVDIEADDALQKKYFDQIPVVEIGPYRLKAPISKADLAMTLGAAHDRRDQLVRTDGDDYRERVRRGQTLVFSDRIYFWMARHYLALLNLILFVYVGLPFAAPVLMKAEAPAVARVIYKIYSPLCHQFGFRSFFLFGEQAYYPLRQAGLSGLKSFDEATGIQGASDAYNPARLQARRYTGDETVGFKVALCERDVAIYAAILLFGLIYAATGRRLPSLHWGLWVLLGLGPIGLDGVSQIVSQFQWPWLAQVLPYRESTPLLRVLTGGLFGFLTAWFAFPNIEESMRETRQFFMKKFAVARASSA